MAHTYTLSHRLTPWLGEQVNRVSMRVLNMPTASSANNPLPYHHSETQGLCIKTDWSSDVEQNTACPHLFASLAWSACRATFPWDARFTLGSHFTLGEWRGGGSERRSESDQWHPKHISVTCMISILMVKMSHHTFCPSIPDSPFAP